MRSIHSQAATNSSIAALFDLGQVTAIDYIDFPFVLGDIEALLRDNHKAPEEFIPFINELILTNKLPSSPLDEMIRNDKLGKLTSNPAILEKAITRPDDPIFTPLIRHLKHVQKLTSKQIWNSLSTLLIRIAAKKFEPLYLESNGRFGIVSIETDPLEEDISLVSPEQVQIYLEQVETFSSLSPVGNIDVKLASTATGIAVLEESIARGIKINSTTIFPDAMVSDISGSIKAPQYINVVTAYINGLEKFITHFLTQLNIKDIKDLQPEDQMQLRQRLSQLISVDSQFVSRGGVLVHCKLLNETQNENFITHFKMPLEIAQLKVIHEIQRTIFEPDYVSSLKFPAEIMELSSRFNKLEMLGAQPKYLFFASTGVKDSQFDFMKKIYGDHYETAYIEELIAPNSLGTHPPATYHAFNRSSVPSRHTISDNIELAVEALRWLYKIDANLPQKVNAQLLNEGYDQFLKAYRRCLSFIDQL